MKIRYNLLSSIITVCMMTYCMLSCNSNEDKNKSEEYKTKDIAVICIGNSITYGAQHKYPEFTAPPVILTQIIRDSCKAKVVLRNCGVCGATTYDFLPEANRLFPNVVKAVKSVQAETNAPIIFSIMLGTNDSACSGPAGSPVSNKNYKNNLETIIQELRKISSGATFVLHRPIWYSPNTHNGAVYLEEGLARLNGYQTVLHELAAEHEDIVMGDEDAYSFFEEKHKEFVCPENGHLGVFYLHPNEKGSEKLAHFWYRALKAYF